jgi:hypothetical protein
MRCAVCNGPLNPWEVPQAMVVDGRKVWPAAVCDACLRGDKDKADGDAAAG